MTNDYIFTDIPQVQLLQWLARGSLKQNLSRSIRLWVWLRSLYGEDQERLPLTDGFTLADWRDAFFTATHPKGETIPKPHDRRCNCAKTTAGWLFNENTGISELEWRRSLISHLAISPSSANNIPPISSAKNVHIIQSERDLEKLLQHRLFAITRRSLQADLTLLAALGWLEYNGEKYYRVQKLPSRPIAHKINSPDLDFLNHEDLADIARNLSQDISGVQRFLLKLDYVVTATDEVDNWQYELKQLWQQNPIPPIKLTYDSARLGKDVECFVYPVCVYYVQRAVYLCAFGQSPDRKTEWYNFRLDRIQEIRAIDWTNPQIPSILQQRYHQGDLPKPEEIELQMSKSWGFDFYLPSRIMLLRFERNYHQRYIQNTFRHDTFELISHTKARSLIRQHTPEKQQQQTLLKLLDSRPHDDAYYKVNYRHGDNNVIMRLRAWRPKLEVIMPQDLRQSIADDITKEMQFYQDLLNL